MDHTQAYFFKSYHLHFYADHSNSLPHVTFPCNDQVQKLRILHFATCELEPRQPLHPFLVAALLFLHLPRNLCSNEQFNAWNLRYELVKPNYRFAANESFRSSIMKYMY